MSNAQRLFNIVCEVLLVSVLISAAACRHSTPDPSSTGSAELRPPDSSQPSGTNTDVLRLENAELLVALQPGTDPVVVARSHQLTWRRSLHSDPDMHLLVAGSADAAHKGKEALAKDARVRFVYLNSPSLNQPFSR